MDECNNNAKRKRVRGDSEADSPESKILRVNPASSDDNSSESQLTRVNSGESCADSEGYELVINSSGVNEIQDELLNILDDTDNVTERDPTMQDLDSFIKSFEEEILAPGPDSADSNTEPGPGPGPDSADPNTEPEFAGVFNTNLGYLLEASDDELGLPPTVTPNSEEGKQESEESGRVGPEGVDLTGFFGFEDDIGSYEGFGFGNSIDYDGGYVTIDGLFDYAETADILWRSESLQAM